MDVLGAMAHFAWPAFTERRHDLPLVVAHAPVGVCEDPAALMNLLIERLQPEGDFALSSEQTSLETTLFCAFEQASDASVFIDALCGHEDNRHPGLGKRIPLLDRQGDGGRDRPQAIAVKRGGRRPAKLCNKTYVFAAWSEA